MNKKILLFIPTLNESGNLIKMLNSLEYLYSKLDILIIDDNSTDKTVEDFNSYKGKLNKKIIIRKDKTGVGSAHVEGIKYAKDKNYDYIITMDCDFTHDPKHLDKDFITNSEYYDFIVGSRYLKSGSLKNWSFRRRFLTYISHAITYIFLGIKFDTTAGYRMYNLRIIEDDFFNFIKSEDYSFFIESGYYLTRKKTNFLQIPVDMPKRSVGQSKLKFKHVINALIIVFRIWFLKFFVVK